MKTRLIGALVALALLYTPLARAQEDDAGARPHNIAHDDEQLRRDLAGQEPFFRTRSQALALYGMDLIVNEN